MTENVGQPVLVLVDDPTKVGDARRQTVLLARELGFDDTRQGKAALVATEAASNLLKHGGGGELVVQGFHNTDLGSILEVSAIDSGPGMKNISQCLADGYSTAGSPGSGLGAIRRIADEFDIYPWPNLGTVLCARLTSNHRAPALREPRFQVGVIRVPCPGERRCGDAWTTIERGGYHFVLVVDGLGHGPSAADAADEAVRVFRGHRSQDPAEIVGSLHEALRATRGAALAIARIDRAQSRARYAGVGNISGVIVSALSGATSSMVSQNGTVGYTIRKIQTFEYPWLDDSILIMHSDGVGTRWKLEHYPGLIQRHPTLIAAVLYRDHKRGRDDATVLVARFGGAERT